MFKFWHVLTQLPDQSIRLPWKMVVTGLALGIFVAIATLLPQIETLDTQILLAIHHLHTPTLDRLMVIITYDTGGEIFLSLLSMPLAGQTEKYVWSLVVSH